MAKKLPAYPTLRAAVVSLDAVTGRLQTLSALRAWRVQTAHRLKRAPSSSSFSAFSTSKGAGK